VTAPWIETFVFRRTFCPKNALATTFSNRFDLDAGLWFDTWLPQPRTIHRNSPRRAPRRGFAVYPVLTGERPPIVRLRTRQGDILSMFHRKQRVAMAHKSGPKGAGMNISVGSSERAPIIYFDGIATYGFQAGVLQLELGASTV
jgi:hypothetical protein